jgi:UDP-N-acetylmuramate dehydrogenase
MSFKEKIEENFSLEDYNTTKINCVARYFLKAESSEDVISALQFAKSKKCSLLVLGKGSNLILPQKYDGLVIALGGEEFQIEERESSIYLKAMSGAFLPNIAKVVSDNLGKGMEWAGGVPGTIGGATRGNAGAFNDFIADYIKKVEVINKSTLEKEILEGDDLLFDYRESIFKKKDDYIIMTVEMEFPKKEEDDGKFQEYLDYRENNHPQEPSSGSVFKNPRVSEDFYKKHPETEKFKELGFVPMRFLTESCGLKGEKIGGAKISEKHPNFIINDGGATGEDVAALINLIKEKIKEKYGIDIEAEVEIVS